MDTRRDEVLVPNCVAQLRIAAYSTSADKGALPNRIIEGQKTHLNRTVHAIAYDGIHDEIVVQSNMGRAVVACRGTTACSCTTARRRGRHRPCARLAAAR